MCPHCRTTVQFVAYDSWASPMRFTEPSPEGPAFEIHIALCPECKCPVVSIEEYRLDPDRPPYEQDSEDAELLDCWLIWPRAAARPPLPTNVPAHLQHDYHEAALVRPLSGKASAALSRRCLQSLLREVAGTKSKDLSDQIEDVLDTLPAFLREQIDAVRIIGNFAAHPQKSKTTGEIIDVEPGEAE